MKTTLAMLALLTGLTTSAQLTWQVDNAHSKVGFEISHLMISEVDGRFGEFNVMAKANSAFNNPEFEVEIKTASINTDNSRRDEHLRSEDYFEAEKYPTIQFKSRSFERMNNKKFKLMGDLTMHGVTKPVVLEGELNGVIMDQKAQKLRAGLELEGKIDRIEFGVGEKNAAMGEEVELVINLEMLQV